MYSRGFIKSLIQLSRRNGKQGRDRPRRHLPRPHVFEHYSLRSNISESSSKVNASMETLYASSFTTRPDEVSPHPVSAAISSMGMHGRLCRARQSKMILFTAGLRYGSKVIILSRALAQHPLVFALNYCRTGAVSSASAKPAI